MFTVLVIGCGVLGLAVGSFLNVVIYRVPRKLSIVTPRSACPICSTPIRDRDNIPVVSWLLLRGRCRTCHGIISWRYPLVELSCSALFAGTAARLGLHWALPGFLILVSSLLALALIDVEHLTLPKKVIYPSMLGLTVFLLLAALIDQEWHRFLVAVICSAGWFVFFFLINLVSPRALGFGDVRLAPMLGLGLGWMGIRYVILGFFIANLVGALIGLTLIALKKMKRDQPIPYGVFLAGGAVIAIFAGPILLSPFQRIA